MRTLVALCLAAGLALPLSAAEETPAPPQQPGPAEVVDLFHQALKEGRTDQALLQMSPDAVVYETGYAERSRDHYASGHVQNDARFSSRTTSKLVRRETWAEGDTACVMSQYQVDGEFGGDKVALEQTETMVLRRNGNLWRIAHIHWSAHNR